MPFPNIVGTITSTNGSTASATPVINLPGSIQAGELLIILIRSGSTGTIGVSSSGFTQLATDLSDASDDTTSILYKVATGSEGATVTLATSSNKFAAISFRVNGAIDPATQLPQLSTVAIGTVAAVDPTTCTPTGGAKDYLWVWLGGWAGTQTSPPASQPTNFSGPTGADTAAGGAAATNCRVALAWRKFNAASLDAGSWTISAAPSGSTVWLMAIHPRAAPVLNATPQQTFALAGQPASFLKSISMPSATGAFAATGSDATLYPTKIKITQLNRTTTSTPSVDTFSTSFSAQPGDVLIALHEMTGGTGGPTGEEAETVLTDDLGGTWAWAASVDSVTGQLSVFVREQRVTSTASMIVKCTAQYVIPNGFILFVASLSPNVKLGAAAVRQFAGLASAAGAAGTAPSLGFTSAALVTNPTLVAVQNATNPPAITPPSGWTEDALGEGGHAAPITGVEYAFRRSGHEGTGAITWGSNSATAYSILIVEFDGKNAYYMPADVGAFAWAGKPSLRLISRFANTKSLNLSGKAATFDVKMPAAVGAFGWVASDAELTKGGGIVTHDPLVADVGAFALAGQAATFDVKLPGAPAAYTLAAQAARLSSSRTSARGAYTLAANAANFALSLPAPTTGYTLAGIAATFKLSMPAATGAFTLTAQAARLSSTRISARGTFTLAASAATFEVKLPASTSAYTLTAQAARLSSSRTSSRGTFLLTASDAGLIPSGAGPKTMPAATGTYALSGPTTTFAITLPATKATFTLAASAATFAIVLPAAKGTFTLAGPTATFSITLPAATGAFIEAGSAARFSSTRKSALATYAWTRFDAGLIYSGSGSKTLTAAPGSLAWTGLAARFSSTRVSARGTFTLTGGAATFAVSLPAAGGTFTLTASPAALRATHRLVAALATFSLTGFDAGLVYSGAGAKTLTAAGATFTETGNAAALRATRKLVSAVGAFTQTGQAAALARGRSLIAAPAAFLETGLAVALRLGRALPAAPAAFTLTGLAAGLLYSGIAKTLVAAPGALVLTGNAATLRVGRRLVVAPGAFAWTGTAALLKLSTDAVFGIEFFEEERARYSVLPDTSPRLDAALHARGLYSATPHATPRLAGTPQARGRYSFTTRTQRAA